MTDMMKRTSREVIDPIRRFLEGDWDTSTIRVEEFIDGTTQVVRAEMPGIDPEKDVDITVMNGVLRIKAKREEKTEHREKGGYRTEFRYGSFTRDIPLPVGVKDDDVTATYSDGVLEVRAPVPEETNPPSRKVQVHRP